MSADGDIKVEDIKPKAKIVKAKAKKDINEVVETKPTKLIIRKEVDLLVSVPGHPKLRMCKTFKIDEIVTDPFQVDLVLNSEVRYDVVED